MDLTIVVPLYNEEESLPHLAEWIDRVMAEHGFSYEVLMIDDGSHDGSWSVVESLHERNSCYKGVRFRRNYGKSAALNVGFSRAQGDVVVTMDADLQDSPEEIPELRRRILEEGYDLVSGWKRKRYDSKLAKNIPSKFFNWTTRVMSGINLHDFNCGLKAYRNDCQVGGLFQDRRDGGPSSQAGVRRDQVRYEPLYQRLSRPDEHHVYVQVRQAAHAFLRRRGLVVVSFRIYRLRGGVRHAHRWLYLADPQCMVLCLHAFYLGRYHALFGWFPR